MRERDICFALNACPPLLVRAHMVILPKAADCPEPKTRRVAPSAKFRRSFEHPDRRTGSSLYLPQSNIGVGQRR